MSKKKREISLGTVLERRLLEIVDPLQASGELSTLSVGWM